MELYETPGNFIILDGEDSLWCNREDGGLLAKHGVDLSQAWKPVCRGRVYGVIGKIQFFPGSDWRLVVISKQTLLGSLPGRNGKFDVCRIDRIAVLPLSSGEVPEIELEFCEEHQRGMRPRKLLGGAGDSQQKGLGQSWRTALKTAATNIKGNVKTTNMKDRELKDKEKLERRFSEELLKMFNDTECFYYSPNGDMTNSVQRQFSSAYDSSLPVWKRNNEDFFWNKFMLQDLINSEDTLSSKWILPIIQGYCKITHCLNTFEDEETEEATNPQNSPLPPEEFDLAILSRRSVTRAGTRYRRRGVDENGDVANYVETEQVICTASHNVSFVQVRGSVPVYWSQPGYKYRPPPRLDRDDKATQASFKRHFDRQLELFKSVVAISLVDKSGREKVIADAFMDHILHYNSALLTFVTFDFHEYCRGMKFENVSVLVESILELIKDMRYCWTDAKGMICEQRSVFRTNCMDCLDRTNVVQAAIARQVAEVQLRKLGKLLPDQPLPASVRATFQDMWANNGDAISLQYAGTAAMKGDFTRTGERKFTGVMKDGYNSANRYYLNRFKAAYRQTLIDLMLGKPPTEDISALIAAMGSGSDEEQWTMEREECVVQLVEYCHQLLLTEDEECLGGWALVEPFYSPDGETDVILLLTFDAYYVASYDDEAEKVTQYERIALEDVDKIEIGPEPTFRSKYLFMRIHRKFNGTSGYFHTLRMIQHRTPEDARSVLHSIADAFATAREHKNLSLKINECRLDRKKSKPASEIVQISSKTRLSGWSRPSLLSKQRREAKDGYNEEDLRMLERSRPKSRTSSMSSSYSDPCLARHAGHIKTECKSAPVSSGEESDQEPSDQLSEAGPGTETNSDCTESARAQAAVGVPDDDTWAKIEGVFENLEKADMQLSESDGDDEGDKDAASEDEETVQPDSGGSDNNDDTTEHGGPDAHSPAGSGGSGGVVSTEGVVEGTSAQQQGGQSVGDATPNGHNACGTQGSEAGAGGEQTMNGEARSNGRESERSAERKLKEVAYRRGKMEQEDYEGTVDINLKSSTASLTIHASSSGSDDPDTTERRASPEPTDRTRKFTDRFRLPGNRSPKFRILATAQARGKTIIPDLRNKLSSFSQQMRNRGSPRLGLKRDFLYESSLEQKTRRRKCRTRIIEL